MRALVLGADGPRVEGRAFHGHPGEATVRVSVAGVCATDLELVQGYMGFQGVLGHEFVGVVEHADNPHWIGRRVVGEINCPCGRCEVCRAGRGNHCPNRSVLGIQGRDGAFAERLSLPLANLHPVPDGVPDDAAVFVEPLAAACQILEMVHVPPSCRVLVMGLGRLGQLIARVLALTGADVTGVSRSEARRALLPLPTATPEQVRGGADLVVEATGSPEGLAQAAKWVRPRGTVVLKSTVHDLGEARPTGWVVDEITIVGSRCGPFAPALRLLERGLIDPRPLISARLPLSDGLEALARARAPGVVKVLLDPHS